jgi:hypothetical protein
MERCQGACWISHLWGSFSRLNSFTGSFLLSARQIFSKLEFLSHLKWMQMRFASVTREFSVLLIEKTLFIAGKLHSFYGKKSIDNKNIQIYWLSMLHSSCLRNFYRLEISYSIPLGLSRKSSVWIHFNGCSNVLSAPYCKRLYMSRYHKKRFYHSQIDPNKFSCLQM